MNSIGDRNFADAVHAEVRNGNKARSTECGSICSSRSWGGCYDFKRLGGARGGLLPLNFTVASLGSDTVGVGHPSQHLAVAVAQDTSGDSSEPLGTICGGPGERTVSQLDHFETFTYFQEAVQEICLARMLYVLAVVYPLLPHVRVMVIVSVEVAPNSVYTKSTNGFKFCRGNLSKQIWNLL